MALFTSGRERRLWGSLLIVIVAIFTTLTFAGGWAASLGDQGVDAITFVVGALLVLTAAVTQGADRRFGAVDMCVAAGIAGVAVLVVTRLTSPAERSHLVEYGVVAILLYGALNERRRNGRRVPVPALIAVGVTAIIGTVDELVQMVLPNRVFDPVDIGFNAGAAMAAVSAGVVHARAKRRRARRLSTGDSNGGRPVRDTDRSPRRPQT